MLVPNADAAFRRPDWLENFQMWVARLSPAILADLIEVVALELRKRDIDDHGTLSSAGKTLREDRGARVQQLVDALWWSADVPLTARQQSMPPRVDGAHLPDV